MKQSDLLNYLQNKISASDLLEKYRNDIEDYKLKMLKKGSTININFDYSNDKILINKNTVIKIYTDFINDKLDFYLMCYIADIFTLYNNIEFENEDVRENIEAITDYEYGSINKEFLKKQLLNL